MKSFDNKETIHAASHHDHHMKKLIEQKNKEREKKIQLD